MSKPRKLGAAGRFGVRYGQSAKKRITAIETIQRKKQKCLFCKGKAKRLSKGIWQCKKCGKKFAGHAYYLEQPYLGNTTQADIQKDNDAKALKKENTSEDKETKLNKGKKNK